MMARGPAVNDPGGRAPIDGKEIIRIWFEDEGFIPSWGLGATASFLFLD
jgi:hypothetical protein